jgi:hypothetical protein
MTVTWCVFTSTDCTRPPTRTAVVPSIVAANAPVMTMDDAAAINADLNDPRAFLAFVFMLLLLPDK